MSDNGFSTFRQLEYSSNTQPEWDLRQSLRYDRLHAIWARPIQF